MPVGSSANTTSGWVTSAAGDRDALLLAARQLARAVLEPIAEADGVDHLVEPRRRRARGPARSNGSPMFSCAVSVGSRLNAWNTKPTRSRRSTGELVVDELGEVDGRR